jgi:hypothetical protein
MFNLAQKQLNKKDLGQHEDWYGNNAAINCAVCGKLYIASKFLNKGFRKCPCGKSAIKITATQVTVTFPEENHP